MDANEDGKKEETEATECKGTTTALYMWGYLPGVSSEKSPMLSPVPVRLPDSVQDGESSWKDVCGGGCGFAMALSENGKLMTWGSAEEEGQSYVMCGRHGEIPEAITLPSEAAVVNAVAGWAHCVSVTESGEVYTWGWKECVPPAKFPRDVAGGGTFQKDGVGQPIASLVDQATAVTVSHPENKETIKKRKVSASAKDEYDSPSPSGDDYFTVLPSLVSLSPGVRITSVAAGGRHTLALSDMGQVWGWGYGGEGQLGLGSRIKMVSSPRLITCLELPSSGKDRSSVTQQGSITPSGEVSKFPGSFVKEIACGGRHSAVVTDTGELLTFGWGLYGQCGQGNTSDQLKPTSIPSLSGVKVKGIAAGLWHTVCVTADGFIYSFGGNQFGQLGTGAEQGEIQPKLLDAPSLENRLAKMVSCGARHSAVLTEDGQVLCWGWNKYGQLGLGDSIDRNIPSLVPTESCQPKYVACGWWHTLLLAETSP
ncbi:hypothetical protein Tsubulata_002786 [Turnera subulata]|uniref:RCC1-like domain-containing protein n=1 Tax=Turnera subulata TaxID=218843 RepID=A0A9Q0JAE8_9ROSI|nr:hypothetical protein Tsubulata_002786 [Turnera subulata]